MRNPGRGRAVRPAKLRAPAVLFLVWITACKDGGTPACTPVTFPEPVACDGAAAPRWAIGGFATDRVDGGSGAASVGLAVGESVKLSVRRAGDAGDGCAATVESVTWSVSNRGVASLTPVGQDAWIKGVSVGETAVSASIVFKDSPPQVVAPRMYVSILGAFADVLVRVVPAAAPSQGAIRIAHGSVSLAAYAAGRSDASAAIPFETSVAGHLDVTVDWSNPANPMEVTVGGPCPGPTCTLIPNNYSEQTKPIHLSGSQFAPGSFMLRINNKGPETEAVSYEVWLTPGG